MSVAADNLIDDGMAHPIAFFKSQLPGYPGVDLNDEADRRPG